MTDDNLEKKLSEKIKAMQKQQADAEEPAKKPAVKKKKKENKSSGASLLSKPYLQIDRKLGSGLYGCQDESTGIGHGLVDSKWNYVLDPKSGLMVLKKNPYYNLGIEQALGDTQFTSTEETKVLVRSPIEIVRKYKRWKKKLKYYLDYREDKTSEVLYVPAHSTTLFIRTGFPYSSSPKTINDVVVTGDAKKVAFTHIYEAKPVNGMYVVNISGKCLLEIKSLSQLGIEEFRPYDKEGETAARFYLPAWANNMTLTFYAQGLFIPEKGKSMQGEAYLARIVLDNQNRLKEVKATKVRE